MGLIGAAVTFQAGQFLPECTRDGAQRRSRFGTQRNRDLAFGPPIPLRVLSYLGYLTGIIGTGIWGYGDLLLQLVS